MNYYGEFNYNGEVSKLETSACTLNQAWSFFCYGLAKKYGVTRIKMYNYFDGLKDNYTIRQQVRRV